MNERALIEAVKRAHPIAEGSQPSAMTAKQQHACYVVGKLLIHAHRKGKRKMGRWV